MWLTKIGEYLSCLFSVSSRFSMQPWDRRFNSQPGHKSFNQAVRLTRKINWDGEGKADKRLTKLAFWKVAGVKTLLPYDLFWLWEDHRYLFRCHLSSLRPNDILRATSRLCTIGDGLFWDLCVKLQVIVRLPKLVLRHGWVVKGG